MNRRFHVCILLTVLMGVGCGGDDDSQRTENGGNGTNGGSPLVEGRYDGDFECTELDADIAFFNATSGILGFEPSASSIVEESTVTNLQITADTVAFAAVFENVPGEDPVLSFTFELNVEDFGSRLDGVGTLRLGSGGTETCTATFSQ